MPANRDNANSIPDADPADVQLALHEQSSGNRATLPGPDALPDAVAVAEFFAYTAADAVRHAFARGYAYPAPAPGYEHEQH